MEEKGYRLTFRNLYEERSFFHWEEEYRKDDHKGHISWRLSQSKSESGLPKYVLVVCAKRENDYLSDCLVFLKEEAKALNIVCQIYASSLSVAFDNFEDAYYFRGWYCDQFEKWVHERV